MNQTKQIDKNKRVLMPQDPKLPTDIFPEGFKMERFYFYQPKDFPSLRYFVWALWENEGWVEGKPSSINGS